MPTFKQDTDFRAAIIPLELLDNAIDWIITNLSLEDVYPEKALIEWAEANGYSKNLDDGH